MAVSASEKLWIVSASSATEPVSTTIASCTSAVTINATNDTFTAWMPRSLASSTLSIESAASWLWGRKISAKAPRRPRVCSWS